MKVQGGEETKSITLPLLRARLSTLLDLVEKVEDGYQKTYKYSNRSQKGLKLVRKGKG